MGSPQHDSSIGVSGPLLVAVAVFSLITNCNGKARLDKVEKQQAEIQAMVLEIRERTK